MQQYTLHPSINKLSKAPIMQALPEAAEQLREKLRGVKTVLKHKMPWSQIQALFKISRSSYYRLCKELRHKGLQGLVAKSKKPRKLRISKISQDTIKLILRLRQESPTYGKAKITILLRRDHGINLSESSVGRVLNKLKAQGLITQSKSAGKSRRKRRFNSHAKQWTYDMKATKPGEMVQIDHMSCIKNQCQFKHFHAWDPTTKMAHAKATSNANSFSAKRFLNEVLQAFPFKVTSIQVDGGSEFMKHFEEECAIRGISLFVLPPKRPQYNGGVERGNRIFREEFYANSNLLADAVQSINYELQKSVLKYNSYRPHFNLKGLTPLEYYKSISEVA